MTWTNKTLNKRRKVAHTHAHMLLQRKLQEAESRARDKLAGCKNRISVQPSSTATAHDS